MEHVVAPFSEAAGCHRPLHNSLSTSLSRSLAPYRQDSDFLWLTGVKAPGYALVMDPRRGDETLFVPKLTQEHAVWMGRGWATSRAGARRERFGIADVRCHDELPKALRRFGA